MADFDENDYWIAISGDLFSESGEVNHGTDVLLETKFSRESMEEFNRIHSDINQLSSSKPDGFTFFVCILQQNIEVTSEPGIFLRDESRRVHVAVS